MKQILKVIQVIVQMVTIALSIFTIIEIVKAWRYKRKLAQKAQEYLEDEFVPEANLGTSINVYSPTIKENNHKVRNLLVATGVSCIAVVVMNALSTDRD